MKWTDNELDEHFKTNTPEIPAYDASFWKEVEPLLPQKNSKKRFFILFGSLLGMIAIAGSIYFMRDDNTLSASEKTSVDTSYPTYTHPSNTLSQTDSDVEMSVTNHSPVRQSITTKTPESMQNLVTTITGSFNKKTNENVVHATAQLQSTQQTDKAVINPLSDIANEDQIAEGQEEKTSVTETDSIQPEVKPTLIPEKESVRVTRGYAQVLFGIGQSAIKSIPGKSASLQSYAIGGGLTHEIGRMQLGFGGQFRMDVAQNIQLREPLDQGTSLTHYQRVFSFETPLSIGYSLNRWLFDVTLTPGIQTFFSGKYMEYTTTQLVREEVKTGTIHQAKSTTMEIGLRVQYSLSPKWQLGAGIATDVIQPYNRPAYEGSSRTLPTHIQLGLRRRF